MSNSCRFRYCYLWNKLFYNQDENIGGHIIQQNMNGRPVGMFRFPPKTVLKAGAYTTVSQSSTWMLNTKVNF